MKFVFLFLISILPIVAFASDEESLLDLIQAKDFIGVRDFLNSKAKDFNPEFERDDGLTAPIAALESDDAEIIGIIFDPTRFPFEKYDLNIKEKNSARVHTALSLAAQKGCEECIETLLNFSSDKPKRETLRFAILQAVLNSRDQIASLLIDQIDATKIADDLVKRLVSGDFPHALTTLVNKEGFDINQKLDDEGRTPLMYAVTYKNPEAVQIILGANANVNQQDSNGETAWILAAKMYEPESEKGLGTKIYDLLANANPIPQIHDEYNLTAPAALAINKALFAVSSDLRAGLQSAFSLPVNIQRTPVRSYSGGPFAIYLSLPKDKTPILYSLLSSDFKVDSLNSVLNIGNRASLTLPPPLSQRLKIDFEKASLLARSAPWVRN